MPEEVRSISFEDVVAAFAKMKASGLSPHETEDERAKPAQKLLDDWHNQLDEAVAAQKLSESEVSYYKIRSLWIKIHRSREGLKAYSSMKLESSKLSLP